MYELMNLSGQEYVDIYAATFKGRSVGAVDRNAPVAPSARMPETAVG
jgi:1-acyl-sn-glycerol-3-phosphate acyltransferase